MARPNLAGLAAFIGAVALVACSDQTPVTPGLGSSAPTDARAVAGAATGSYQLSFFKSVAGVLEPVSSLTIYEELILGAHVADGSGAPAQGGSVTFQYCSLKGGPSNDINRPDEAPSSECATRAASWANLVSVPVNASGDAYMDFGFVIIPRTVGFRFRYSGQGSGISNGTSAPADFTWNPSI